MQSSRSPSRSPSHEELLGDLLDCIPDSMEEVLDRQKVVAAAAAAAEAAAAAAAAVKNPAPVTILHKPVEAVVLPAVPQVKTPKAVIRKAATKAESKSTKKSPPAKRHPHQPVQITSAKLLQPVAHFSKTFSVSDVNSYALFLIIRTLGLSL